MFLLFFLMHVCFSCMFVFCLMFLDHFGSTKNCSNHHTSNVWSDVPTAGVFFYGSFMNLSPNYCTYLAWNRQNQEIIQHLASCWDALPPIIMEVGNFWSPLVVVTLFKQRSHLEPRNQDYLEIPGKHRDRGQRSQVRSEAPHGHGIRRCCVGGA